MFFLNSFVITLTTRSTFFPSSFSEKITSRVFPLRSSMKLFLNDVYTRLYLRFTSPEILNLLPDGFSKLRLIFLNFPSRALFLILIPVSIMSSSRHSAIRGLILFSYVLITSILSFLTYRSTRTSLMTSSCAVHNAETVADLSAAVESDCAKALLLIATNTIAIRKITFFMFLNFLCFFNFCFLSQKILKHKKKSSKFLVKELFSVFCRKTKNPVLLPGFVYVFCFSSLLTIIDFRFLALSHPYSIMIYYLWIPMNSSLSVFLSIILYLPIPISAYPWVLFL